MLATMRKKQAKKVPDFTSGPLFVPFFIRHSVNRRIDYVLETQKD